MPFLFPVFFLFIYLFIFYFCFLIVFLYDTAFQTHRSDVFIALVAYSDIPASNGELNLFEKSLLMYINIKFKAFNRGRD